MNKKLLIGVGVTAVCAVGYYVYNHRTPTVSRMAMTMPAVNVQVAQTKKEDVPVIISSLGTVIPSETVVIKSRVEGHLMKVAFAEGARVKQGDLLAKLDTRAFENTLMQYEGTLAQNRALLKNAKTILSRYQKLIKSKSISEQTYEAQQAQVSQYEGAVRTNEAQVRSAKLNIEYATMTAPISGTVGLKGYDVGNLVTANASTPICTITNMKPAHVVFSVAQSSVAPVIRRFYAGETLEVMALDQKTGKELARGNVIAVDNIVDVATGTVKVKASFDNNEETLLANAAVSVRLVADVIKGAVTVDQNAVQTSTTGQYVFVTSEDKKAKKRPVRVGVAAPRDRVVIERGLAPGTVVITSGVSNLSEGSAINVVESKEVDLSVLNRPKARRQRKGDGQSGPGRQGRGS